MEQRIQNKKVLATFIGRYCKFKGVRGKRLFPSLFSNYSSCVKIFFLSLCVSSLSKITLKEANFKKVNKSVRNTGLACYSFLFPPLKPVQSLSRLYMAQICPFVHIKSHPKNGVISSFHWNQYITLSVSPLHYIQILCRYLQSRKNF